MTDNQPVTKPLPIITAQRHPYPETPPADTFHHNPSNTQENCSPPKLNTQISVITGIIALMLTPTLIGHIILTLISIYFYNLAKKTEQPNKYGRIILGINIVIAAIGSFLLTLGLILYLINGLQTSLMMQ